MLLPSGLFRLRLERGMKYFSSVVENLFFYIRDLSGIMDSSSIGQL